MEKKIKTKVLFFNLIVVCFLCAFSISSVSVTLNPSQPWTSQSTGCKSYTGYTDIYNNYVYLGIGNVTPTTILNDYPLAVSNFLEDVKTNLVNMSLGQFKSFEVLASNGFTNSSSQFYRKNLFYQVTIEKIWNDDGSHITSRNSVIILKYTLYTDCALGGVNLNSFSSNQDILLGSFSNIGFFIAVGLIIIIGLLSVVSFILHSQRKPNLNTTKIIEENKEKEIQRIKSLKETLDTSTKNTNVEPITTKRNRPYRRRK